jgi:hypothetical protein
VIRQAISCDICGAEKRQTNHWFVAYEQAGELRVSGWTSRHRSRPGSKHLCGQTCLHKLVDDFMARAIAVRPQISEADVAPAVVADASLTSSAAYAEAGSPMRLLTPAAPPVLPQPVPRAKLEPAIVSARFDPAECAAPLDEPPRYASRAWRAEAWERERERELRTTERRPEVVARRSS